MGNADVSIAIVISSLGVLQGFGARVRIKAVKNKNTGPSLVQTLGFGTRIGETREGDWVWKEDVEVVLAGLVRGKRGSGSGNNRVGIIGIVDYTVALLGCLAVVSTERDAISPSHRRT